MSILDSCKHQFAVHGLAVDLASEVPLLNLPIQKALGEFSVSEWPDGFSATTGLVGPYDQNVVLRHLSPTAAPVVLSGSTVELYEERERFWLIDDRWGLAEINLLKGHWQSWILPEPSIEPAQVVQQAILWPLAQLLRLKGLHLLPAISVARDGWGMLILSPFGIEPEISALARSGYRIIGQQWTALREEDGRVAMLHLPGQIHRLPAPQLKAGGLEQSDFWLDINAEVLGSTQNHSFCDAVALVSPGRRPLPAMRQVNRSEALSVLRQSWPIIELHPQRRQGQIPVRLSGQCRCYETQLSRRPEDFLKLLDQMRLGRSDMSIVPQLTLMLDKRPKIPA